MSEWFVRVVNTKNTIKHPGADLLSIVTIDGGYPCIIRTEDIQPLMVYVPIDSVVPEALNLFWQEIWPGSCRRSI